MRRAQALLVSLAMVSSAVLLAAPASAGPDLMVRFGYAGNSKSSPVVYEPSATARAGFPVDQVWDGTGKPYGGGLVFDGSFGFKVIPYLSLGVGGGLMKTSSDSAAVSVDGLERTHWSIGPYFRGYFPMVPIVAPWVSVGVRYVADTQNYTRPSPSFAGITEKWALEHHGIGVPLTLGVDYPILPMLFAGPSFEYTVIFPAGGCAKVTDGSGRAGNSFCASEAENKRITATKGYGTWSVGLQVRLTM